MAIEMAERAEDDKHGADNQLEGEEEVRQSIEGMVLHLRIPLVIRDRREQPVGRGQMLGCLCRGCGFAHAHQAEEVLVSEWCRVLCEPFGGGIGVFDWRRVVDALLAGSFNWDCDFCAWLGRSGCSLVGVVESDCCDVPIARFDLASLRHCPE